MKRRYEKVIEQCQDCPIYGVNESWVECVRRGLHICFGDDNFKETKQEWFATCDLPEVDALPFPLETWIPATKENMDKIDGIDEKKYLIYVNDVLDFHIIDKNDRFAIFRMPKEMKDAQL